MNAEDPLGRAEVLLERLESARTRLEATGDPDVAIEILQELAQLSREIEVELQRARGDAEAAGPAPDDA